MADIRRAHHGKQNTAHPDALGWGVSTSLSAAHRRRRREQMSHQTLSGSL